MPTCFALHRAARTTATTAMLIAGTVVAGCQRPWATVVAPMSGKRVESDRGMVAASHPDAAAAGAAILAQGGNAVDAFAATAFALSVTDVSQTGLGGGGAMTFFNAKTKTVEHLSFYPRAGEDTAWARADSSRGRRPGRAAATPGMVAGVLEAQAKWGKLTRAQVLAPAIALARNGFVVSPLLARTIASSRDKLLADSLAAARFMPRGEALRPGDRLIQPELGATLQRIASEGATVFYNGGIAERLSAKVKAQGGLITVRDMNTYFVTSMRPLCAMWRGYTLLGAPPPMGGASVLEMLQLADAAGVADAGSFTENGAAVAKLADIMRIGNADAGEYRGDPAVQRVPAHGVVHPDFARQRAGLVGGALPDTAVAGNPWAFDTLASPGTCGRFNPYPASTTARTGSSGSASRDTTAADEGQSYTSHLAVVDGDGSAVSATTTVGVLFGSGVYTDGFFLNSAGNNFDPKTRGTNRYANSTMSPTLILDGDKVRLVVGAAGSQYIQPAITQVTIRMLAFGEDPAVALAAPRIHASDNLKEVEVEPGFATSVYQALVARGYAPSSRLRDISFGGVHAVFVRKDGKRIGVADPRRDGTAAGW
ncbi:gamma-glutamyltransferase family protein [Gemmatimonas sp.]|uniref:gamma-glutamyltransferase family protein n=1 Tax=Gemmatimonas sp. TaxID=1962908 RepID=UPI0039832577